MFKFNKLFIVFFIVLFISGCDGSYNLYISDDEFKENINFKMENSLYISYPLMEFKQYPIYSDTNIVYNNSLTSDNDLKNVSMNYTFKPDDYGKSTALNTCFSNHKFINDKKYFEISLSGEFNCLYGDNFDINIITDNKVISNNADDVKNNVYTWHVSSENKDHLVIEMKIAKKEYNDLNYLFIIVGIAICLSLPIIIWYIYYRKSKSRNHF